jgi:RNAse (barnase) inhibitor barstar
MSEQWQDLFTGAIPPALYVTRSRAQVKTIAGVAERHGWRCFHLAGSNVTTKATFLRRCAQLMDFPAYFGSNWDAFEECLHDLTWLPARGYLLLYEDVAAFARHNPAEWATAYDILDDAVAHWRKTATPFVVLFRKTDGLLPEVARL